jgi:hypothetical protein
VIKAPIIKVIRKVKKKNFDKGMSKNLGVYKTKIYQNINFNTTKVGHGVPCSHKCIIVGYGSFTDIKYHKEE